MIRLTIPSITFEEIEADLREVLQTGWLTGGPKLAALEDAVRNRVGARHAIGVANGTAALHAALLALDVGPGDEVVCADYTFPATANSVEFCGARAVLCDVDPDTYNISVEDLARRIGPRTKALMPVHQFGLPADMDPILELAKSRGIPVLEDAACAIGARYKGREAGRIGKAGTFSFHPRKVITSGEGGMVVTDDDEVAARVTSLRNHGMRDVGGHKAFAQLGYNYRMCEPQAVLGLAQMRKLDTLVAERKELGARLSDLLRGAPGLHLPVCPPGSEHIYQSYVVRLDEGIDRDRVVERLRADGVEATTGAAACHTLPYYQEKYGYRDGDLPGSFRLFRQTVTLPLYPGMPEADADAVAERLRRALEER